MPPATSRSAIASSIPGKHPYKNYREAAVETMPLHLGGRVPVSCIATQVSDRDSSGHRTEKAAQPVVPFAHRRKTDGSILKT